MRRHTIRSGLRLMLAALLLIILATFYHGGVADLLSLSPPGEYRFYSLGIFWAAAIGGYGVVLAAFGFVLPAGVRDAGVRLLPVFVCIVCAVALFFYLVMARLDAPPGEQRLRPGTTITI